MNGKLLNLPQRIKSIIRYLPLYLAYKLHEPLNDSFIVKTGQIRRIQIEGD